MRGCRLYGCINTLNCSKHKLVVQLFFFFCITGLRTNSLHIATCCIGLRTYTSVAKHESTLGREGRGSHRAKARYETTVPNAKTALVSNFKVSVRSLDEVGDIFYSSYCLYLQLADRVRVNLTL